MSFLAKLYIDYDETTGTASGPEYNVLNAEYSLQRQIDGHTNRPNGRLIGGIIDLTIESQHSNVFISWITNTEVKNGLLEFNRRDSAGRSQRNILFKNTYCIYLKELFNSIGSTPMLTKVTLSAHELEIMGETITNSWAGMESSSSSSTTSESHSSETRIEASENTVSFDNPS